MGQKHAHILLWVHNVNKHTLKGTRGDLEVRYPVNDSCETVLENPQDPIYVPIADEVKFY